MLRVVYKKEEKNRLKYCNLKPFDNIKDTNGGFMNKYTRVNKCLLSNTTLYNYGW